MKKELSVMQLTAETGTSRLFWQARGAIAGLGMVLMAALALQPLGVSPANARGAPDSFADLAERLSPAVVNISTSQTVSGRQAGRPPVPGLPEGSPFEDFFEDFLERQGRQGAPRRVQSLGSGFVISADGYVITNNHVIDGADEIKVIFADGESLPAELIGRDAKTDLAVLKIESDDDFPFVPFGDSNSARVGDWVMAIGNPFGLGGTVTAGIISAINRDINAGPYDDFIQTDASINRGNSGGPLFNMAGEVVGVNTAIISPSGGSIGIGFAIPAATAVSVVEQLREFGETRRGWLGVRIQSVTEEIAEGLGMDEPKGALVAGVNPEGPAQDAGIEPGDVIVVFDGKDVAEMRDLPKLVAETAIGRTVDIEVLRDGREKELQVEIARLDETDTADAGNGKEDKSDESGTAQVLGLGLSRLTTANRGEYNVPSEVDGVLVTYVDPASAAAEKGIRRGDVIVEVAQNDVRNPGEVAERVEEEKESGRKSVLLLLASGGDLRFVAVRIGADD
jgi:serine protease Do